MIIILRILILTLIMSYGYYLFKRHIRKEPVVLSKVLLVALLINIGVYVFLGLLAYLVN